MLLPPTASLDRVSAPAQAPLTGRRYPASAQVRAHPRGAHPARRRAPLQQRVPPSPAIHLDSATPPASVPPPPGALQASRSYTAFPSRSADLSTSPGVSPRRATSSGSVGKTSMAARRPRRAFAMLAAVSRLSPKCGTTTSRSRSLSGCASPRAYEPKRMMRSGSNPSTRRAMASGSFSQPHLRRASASVYSCARWI